MSDEVTRLTADLAAANAQLDILRANIGALVDETRDLQAANARLGEAAKALILEKGELQRELARVSKELQDATARE